MSEFINMAVEERSLRETRLQKYRKAKLDAQEREIHVHSACKTINNVRNLIRDVICHQTHRRGS
jgi:hypothetical protein